MVITCQSHQPSLHRRVQEILYLSFSDNQTNEGMTRLKLDSEVSSTILAHCILRYHKNFCAHFFDSTRYGTFQAPIPLATTEHSHASFPSAYFFIQCPSVKRLQYHNFEVLDMIRTTPPPSLLHGCGEIDPAGDFFPESYPCLSADEVSIHPACGHLPSTPPHLPSSPSAFTASVSSADSKLRSPSRSWVPYYRRPEVLLSSALELNFTERIIQPGANSGLCISDIQKVLFHHYLCRCLASNIIAGSAPPQRWPETIAR